MRSKANQAVRSSTQCVVAGKVRPGSSVLAECLIIDDMLLKQAPGLRVAETWDEYKACFICSCVVTLVCLKAPFSDVSHHPSARNCVPSRPANDSGVRIQFPCGAARGKCCAFDLKTRM